MAVRDPGLVPESSTRGDEVLEGSGVRLEGGRGEEETETEVDGGGGADSFKRLRISGEFRDGGNDGEPFLGLSVVPLF